MKGAASGIIVAPVVTPWRVAAESRAQIGTALNAKFQSEVGARHGSHAAAGPLPPGRDWDRGRQEPCAPFHVIAKKCPNPRISRERFATIPGDNGGESGRITVFNSTSIPSLIHPMADCGRELSQRDWRSDSANAHYGPLFAARGGSPRVLYKNPPTILLWRR